MRFINHSYDYRPEGRGSENVRFSFIKAGLVLGAVTVILWAAWSVFH